MYRIRRVRVENQDNPVGIKDEIELNLMLECDQTHVIQTEYQVEIATERSFSDIVYESGIVKGKQSANIRIDEIQWKSLTRYYVRCRSWGVSQDQALEKYVRYDSGWSEPCYFDTAVQHVDEYRGEFISAETAQEADNSKGTYVRKHFQIEKGGIKSAYIISTALGLYDLYLDGRRIGNDELKPGWTSYRKRLLYQTYEITEQLSKDTSHVIGAELAAGWYKGRMGFLNERNNYGSQTAFYCMVLIHFYDGSEQVICTDDTWKGIDSPTIFSEIYDGEIYDLSMEQTGWNQAGYDDSDWKTVSIVDCDKRILQAQTGCTVRVHEAVRPQKLIVTPDKELVLDFGQNLTGWVAVRVRKNVLSKNLCNIKLQFFEVLNADGNVYLDNLRTAKQQYQVLSLERGTDKERVYEPHFTYMGFRYIRIDEYPGEIDLDDFTAYAVHSDMEETGRFECSNSFVNQLVRNIRWGMKGNFVDVPTDCPQRDERCGWTGDAQIFAGTASYLYDTDNFYRKWLTDLALDQTEEGGVPHIIPDLLALAKNNDNWLVAEGTHSASGWADAAVIIPWTLYQMYGDIRVLERQYDSMKSWIDFMTAHSVDGVWDYGVQLGDWLALDAQEGSYYGATPNALVCMAYYAYSSRLFSKIAHVLKKKEDEKKYSDLSESIRSVFQKTYFNNDGDMTVDTQTAHILALHFDLVNERFKSRVAGHLVELIKQAGHLKTGFLGTPYICHVLSENGYENEAYELLLREEYPSWLYQVKKGATTVWEHWDGIKPDGTMWSSEMNSFNHYAYGAIGDWLFKKCIGLSPCEEKPGFQKFVVSPQVGGFTYAVCDFATSFGNIHIGWSLKQNVEKKVTSVDLSDDKQNEEYVQLIVEVPVNTEAVIELNHCRQIIQNSGVAFHREDNERYRGIAYSGSYCIVYEKREVQE